MPLVWPLTGAEHSSASALFVLRNRHRTASKSLATASRVAAPFGSKRSLEFDDRCRAMLSVTRRATGEYRLSNRASRESEPARRFESLRACRESGYAWQYEALRACHERDGRLRGCGDNGLARRCGSLRIGVACADSCVRPGALAWHWTPLVHGARVLSLALAAFPAAAAVPFGCAGCDCICCNLAKPGKLRHGSFRAKRSAALSGGLSFHCSMVWPVTSRT